MANTVTQGTKAISIVPDGSTDFDITTYYGNGIDLDCLELYPSAANDIIVFKEGSASGPIMWQEKALTLGVVRKYFGKSRKNSYWKPYLDADACTFGTPGNVKIVITMR